jgi:hypothetical protein
MVIDRRIHRLRGSGEYGDIFEIEGRAYKLFKSWPEVLPRRTKEGRRQVFENQCAAYRLLSGNPWLERHAARFYGKQDVSQVIGDDGSIESDKYLLDCCYGLELIDSPDLVAVTLPGVREDHKHIRKAAEQFAALGIVISDASVFDHADSERFKFVDFETRFMFSWDSR